MPLQKLIDHAVSQLIETNKIAITGYDNEKRNAAVGYMFAR